LPFYSVTDGEHIALHESLAPASAYVPFIASVARPLGCFIAFEALCRRSAATPKCLFVARTFGVSVFNYNMYFVAFRYRCYIRPFDDSQFYCI
jgi:hypothetical protein